MDGPHLMPTKRRLTRGPRDEAALPDESSITVESAVPREETEDDKKERERVEEVLALSRKRLRTSISGWQFFHDQALDDSRFRAGMWGTKSYQWPDGVQEDRRREERPCVTINRIPSFIRQVTNAARLAKLRIIVVPVDDKGDPDTAETLQGIIRNIETQSLADRAYSMASDKQGEIGMGFFTLVREWADETSFRRRVRIEREIDPLSIWPDPAAQRADFFDGEWEHKISAIDREVYKDRYQKDATTEGEIASLGMDDQQIGDWFPNGKVTIADYVCWERGPRVRKAELSSGKIINYPTEAQRLRLSQLNPPEYVVRDRWMQTKRRVRRVHDATRILEESTWPADGFPWIPMLGDELWIDGERDCRGVTRDAKGSAQAYNVQVSALLEGVGKANKTTVMGAMGQFGAPGSEQRKAWAKANKTNYAFVEYGVMEIGGKQVPAPQAVNFQPDLHNNIMALQQTDNDLKITAGFNDASMGERGPQESGKAIKLRQDQDQLGSSHYLDNHRFSLTTAGRQLIQLIRTDYDTPTVVRITGADNTPKKVMVYSGAANDPRASQPDWQLPEGVDRIHDISVGEFDIEVNASPQHGSRRQEIADQLGALLGTLPPEVAINYLDLYFKVLDIPEAAQMSARAKKMLPKELQDPAEGGQDVPPEVQRQMAEMTAQFQQLEQAAQQMQQVIETEQVKMKGQMLMKQEEIASKERIEHAKAQLAIIQQQGDVKAEQALALLEGEIEKQLLTMKAGFDATLKEMDHENALAAGAVDHAHTTAEGDRQTRRNVLEGHVAHRQKLLEGDVAHRQTVAQGQVAHKQKLQQTVVAAKVKPKAAPKKGRA